MTRAYKMSCRVLSGLVLAAGMTIVAAITISATVPATVPVHAHVVVPARQTNSIHVFGTVML